MGQWYLICLVLLSVHTYLHTFQLIGLLLQTKTQRQSEAKRFELRESITGKSDTISAPGVRCQAVLPRGGTGCRSQLTWFYLLSLCCSGLTVRRKLWISTFSPALAVNIKRFLLTSFLQDFHLYFTFCQTSQIRTGAGSEVNSGLSVE